MIAPNCVDYDNAEKYAKLREGRLPTDDPERQRGLWSFLTWAFLLAQISVAESFVGTASAAASRDLILDSSDERVLQLPQAQAVSESGSANPSAETANPNPTVAQAGLEAQAGHLGANVGHTVHADGWKAAAADHDAAASSAASVVAGLQIIGEAPAIDLGPDVVALPEHDGGVELGHLGLDVDVNIGGLLDINLGLDVGGVVTTLHDSVADILGLVSHTLPALLGETLESAGTAINSQLLGTVSGLGTTVDTLLSSSPLLVGVDQNISSGFGLLNNVVVGGGALPLLGDVTTLLGDHGGNLAYNTLGIELHAPSQPPLAGSIDSQSPGLIQAAIALIDGGDDAGQHTSHSVLTLHATAQQGASPSLLDHLWHA